MAKYFVSPHDQFRNSPFGVMLKSRVRRGKLIKPPANTTANRRVYDLLIAHLIVLCREVGAAPVSDPIKASSKVLGGSRRPSAAWEALIASFETRKADLVTADEGIRLSIAFARGRLFEIGRNERVALKRQLAANATIQRSQQFAAERAANGGEIVFFSSATWQRLRFEVLAEADGCCTLCGRSYREHGVTLEVDHIKPRSRFPNLALEKENLQVLCFDCNRGKGNRDTTDWRGEADSDELVDKVA